MIRLTVPSIEDDDLEAVRDTLSGGYLVQGARVAAFEQAVADRIGSAHAVAVSSGTAALHLALLSVGVGPNDLVLVPAYSWIATANVAALCGAEPVFVDIDPRTFNMDPAALEHNLRALLQDPATASRVKAVVPVHAFGQTAELPALLDLAARHDLSLIEDAACALGAACRGTPAGRWGRAGCFSFHPRKAVTTGEGGMVVTDDPDLARRVRTLRHHGADPAAPVPEFIVPGFNYRMTEFQAALGKTQMSKLSRIVEARRTRAAHYDTLFAGTPVVPPATAEGHDPVYQSYVVLLPPDLASRRKDVIRMMKERGVETTIGTLHMPLTRYYRDRFGYRKGDFPVTDGVFERSLTLPLYETLSARDQDVVAGTLLDVMSELGDGHETP